MSAILVVCPPIAFRTDLCRELEACGFDVLTAPDWISAIQMDLVPTLAAVVFLAGRSSAEEPAWARTLRSFQARRAGIVAMALCDGGRPDGWSAVPGTADLRTPTMVDATRGGPAAIARTIAGLVAYEQQRQEIKVLFDEVYGRYVAGDESVADELWNLTQRAVIRRLGAWPLAAAEPADVVTEAAVTAVARIMMMPSAYDRDLDDPFDTLFQLARESLWEHWTHPRVDPPACVAEAGCELVQGMEG